MSIDTELIKEIGRKTSEKLRNDYEFHIRTFCQFKMPLDAYGFWIDLYKRDGMTKKSKELLSDILEIVYNKSKVEKMIDRFEDGKLSIDTLGDTIYERIRKIKEKYDSIEH